MKSLFFASCLLLLTTLAQAKVTEVWKCSYLYPEYDKNPAYIEGMKYCPAMLELGFFYLKRENGTGKMETLLGDIPQKHYECQGIEPYNNDKFDFVKCSSKEGEVLGSFEFQKGTGNGFFYDGDQMEEGYYLICETAEGSGFEENVPPLEHTCDPTIEEKDPLRLKKTKPLSLPLSNSVLSV